MKKIIILSFVCLLAFNLHAQQNKVAVLNFKADVGISQSDVDGISSIFTTYFSPQGWILVERTQIDKVIKEQGFQKSTMTEQQMVKIGQILNLKKIVIGNVNIISGSYNIDVRIVDVQNGIISAKDGETWTAGTSYRSLMQSLATRLASKIAITKPTTINIVSAPMSQATDIIILYGYLKVFPKNLGVFSNMPTNLINAINNNPKENYGYDSWRLPTQDELELIISNINSVSGISTNQPYMTNENKIETGQKIVRLVTTDYSISEKQDFEKQQREEEDRKKQEEILEKQIEAEKLRQRQQTLGYKIGEIYDKDGMKGVVFSVDTNEEYGKHGKIIALHDAFKKMQWNNAISYCKELNYNWRLPSKNELLEIYANKHIINKALSSPLQNDWYWSADEINLYEALRVSIYGGGVYEYDKTLYNYVRAIANF